MFHRATSLAFEDGTRLCVTFQDGCVKSYDVSVLYDKYPQLMALNDRELFVSGRLLGAYGIVWTDELDLEVETVYEDGQAVGHVKQPARLACGAALAQVRSHVGMTQAQLALECGIDQSDISKIERGAANPTLDTLDRIATVLGRQVQVHFV